MLIKNNTNLDYKELGSIIDLVIKENKEDTLYVGWIQVFQIQYKNKIIKIQIRYLKKYVEWYFKELKEEGKNE